MRERMYDVVLYGATGFTGRQTARYFADHVGSKALRWALAGRDRTRLEAVRADLGEGFAELDIRVADGDDPAAARALAADTRVVLSTAGPFALHGENLVRGCVEAGTDYVDICGETPYVRHLIEAYHERARSRGVRIIPFCGFDSVPSDLGTLFLVDLSRRLLGQGFVEVKGCFSALGGVNGGTLASLYHLFDAGQYGQLRDPFLLNPGPAREQGNRSDQRDPLRPKYDTDLGTWVAPFFMAPVNTRVVRRSHALLSEMGQGYGKGFSYQEYAKVKGPFPRLQAYGAASGLALAVTLCRQRVTRSVLRRLTPKPGNGPSEEVMERGFYRLLLAGRTEDGRLLRVRMQDRGDPGNRVTVKILCQSALALVLDRDKLPGGPESGGILTPATGLGLVLLERLKKTGMEADIAGGLSPA